MHGHLIIDLQFYMYNVYLNFNLWCNLHVILWFSKSILCLLFDKHYCYMHYIYRFSLTNIFLAFNITHFPGMSSSLMTYPKLTTLCFKRPATTFRGPEVHLVEWDMSHCKIRLLNLQFPSPFSWGYYIHTRQFIRMGLFISYIVRSPIRL